MQNSLGLTIKIFQFSFIILLITVSISATNAQAFEVEISENSLVCSFDGGIHEFDNVYAFRASRSTEILVKEILEYVGLAQNFKIYRGTVSNAFAYIENGERFVIYSQNWVDSLLIQTGNEWSTIGVLVHEIGHHLLGHTLDYKVGHTNKENEADEWVGYLLHRMGANLEQAQRAVKLLYLSNNQTSDKYKTKIERLKAIEKGFLKSLEEENRKKNIDIKALSSSKKKIGNQIYEVAIIDSMFWMVENLNYEINNSWCYDLDPEYCKKYGRLYMWESAKQACIEVGWRLPTKQEVEGMAERFGYTDQDYGKLAFEMLKEGGIGNFNGKFGGQVIPSLQGEYRSSRGVGEWGEYWTGVERNDKSAYTYLLMNKNGSFSHVSEPKSITASCRCVKAIEKE
ncbi:FISUMP domain-containing protein [Flavilitoribacter nigricans]|uniref:Fibrobacter succinogenes major paralogous domain-containing protein n=1 Tax=Flavilitoribacter nigricans (strain ATCC 23147 / DSM 23189 / NBRC 102662 / NCIMB 1420 / SS-2) TaxID=1122177 RepID=A0A2D0N7H4_FLAN2|nr:FISUMP domain-containing protein [Flavilitoribacter nigricans]PHN04348.1 hypothetical protein CRP01_22565 [Flavilitoribacter nigricans DSM 23189 = NBRC 102662]